MTNYQIDIVTEDFNIRQTIQAPKTKAELQAHFDWMFERYAAFLKKGIKKACAKQGDKIILEYNPKTCELEDKASEKPIAILHYKDGHKFAIDNIVYFNDWLEHTSHKWFCENPDSSETKIFNEID